MEVFLEKPSLWTQILEFSKLFVSWIGKSRRKST
jgi:hypothetical protein